MLKRLLGLLLMMGILIGTQGAWAEPTETDERLRALEEKIEALEKEKQLAPITSTLSLTDKKVSENSSEGNYIKAKYSYPGFKLETADGLFSTKLVWRAQLRYTYANRSDPRSLSAFTTREDRSNFELRRIRMKIGGHGYKKWIKYYFEIDLQPTRSVDEPSNDADVRVLDWRITVQPIDEIGFRVGQWKVNYNRERVDSSGRQTFVERSIVNRVFTIDRQIGAMLLGRLFKETPADLRYYAGMFNGEGRGVNNASSDLMYMGRLQWNFMGQDMRWRQSDVSYHEQAAGNIAFAVATNNGQCTRWSSSGCGSLPGFSIPPGLIPQFKVDQWVQEFAFKYRGLAIQQEYHQKDVEDKSTGLTYKYEGMYAQIGYFFHGLISAIPENFELAFRYAFVNAPDVINIGTDDDREEFTVGMNYFFAGHNNKVTLDYSYLTLDDQSAGQNLSDNRIRLQWDISF